MELGLLKRRSVEGGVWVFAIKFLTRFLQLIRTIILARLLAPSDFGLLGIALLTILTLDTFSQTGFKEALIQRKKDIKKYLDAAFSILFFRGILLFALLFFIAPYAAAFFNTPSATNVIRVLGVAIIFREATNIGVVYFQRELEFKKQFIFEFAGTIADFFVVVASALILRNVWALVYGFLASNMVKCIVSYVIHPHRPSIKLDWKRVRLLFGFGRWVLGSSILIFIITQGDDIVVGRVLGVAALGFYQMAYLISNLPATEITHVISQVTFPAYSRIQDNVEKLRSAYLKVLEHTTLLSFPLAGLIFLLAPEFTELFLGSKWLPMVPALRILCLYGVMRSVGATVGAVIIGVGKPEIQTRLSSIQLIVLALLILPLTSRWGLAGTASAVLTANIFSSTLVLGEAKKLLGLKLTQLLSKMSAPTSALLVMLAVSQVLAQTLDFGVSYLGFFVKTLTCLGAYVFVVFAFDLKRGNQLTNEVKGIIHSMWGRER